MERTSSAIDQLPTEKTDPTVRVKPGRENDLNEPGSLLAKWLQPFEAGV